MQYQLSDSIPNFMKYLFLTITMVIGLSYSAQAAINVSTSATGAVTLSIPIAVAPGINGMQPNLALTYNSQKNNGLFGMGFSLGGLSQITRCAATVDQDGFNGGINFDYSDRYCLDGQHLVVTPGTSYGAVNTEYKTEIDSFSKIVASSVQSGSGPQSFIIRTKSGRTLEYGTTADSRIYAQGTSTVRIWALKKVSDQNGNYYETSYYPNDTQSFGHPRPSRIDYTGNTGANAAPFAWVEFLYGARGDIEEKFQGGSSSKMPWRVSGIQTNTTTGLVMDYRLVYEEGTATGRSRILSVTSCDSNGVCMPSDSFTWEDADPGFSVMNGIAGWGPGSGYSNAGAYPLITGDWNGDGLTDIGRVSGGGVLFKTSTGSGFTSYNGLSGAWSPSQGFSDANTYPLITGDWNGDGLTDIARVSGGGVLFNVSTGSGFTSYNGLSGTWSPGQGFTDANTYPLLTGDWNGDGLTDIARVSGSGLLFDISTGSGFTAYNALPTWSPSQGYIDGNTYPLLTGDWNGDGLTDIARVGGSGMNFMTSTGSGFATYNGISGTWSPGQGLADANTYPLLTGDWNGDGLTDLGRVTGSGISFMSSTGSGFTNYNGISTWSPGQGFTDGNAYPLITGDWNGDGLTDIGRVTYSGISFMNSTGSGFTSSADYISGWAPGAGGYSNTYTYPLLTGDWDGDGLTDLGRVGYGSIGFKTHNGNANETIIQIISGSGAVTLLVYDPITDQTLYTKDITTKLHEKNIQAPIYVVSQISRDNGIGGQNVTDYHYTGAKLNLRGRGYLGFMQTEVTNQASGVKTTTQYEQTFPFIGRVKAQHQELVDSAGATTGINISHSDNIWSQKFNNGSYAPYVSLNTAYGFEINDGAGNSAISTVSTTMVPDAYGNPLTITQTANAGVDTFTTLTSNTYFPVDLTNWFIGQLDRVTVTKSAPNQLADTRTSSFTWYPVTGLLKDETIEPDSTTLWQKTAYLYDGFGNRTESTMTGSDILPYTTSVAYFPDGQFPSSTTNAKGHSESYTWDYRFGTKSTLTGPNGIITEWAYDGFGRKIAEIREKFRATSTRTDMVYNLDVAPFHIITKNTGLPDSRVDLDALGRKVLVQASDFLGNAVYVKTDYDALGRVKQKSLPYYNSPQAWTVPGYDAIGRTTSVRSPDQSISTTIYKGLTTDVINAKGQKTTTLVNAIGQMVSVTDALGGVMRYEYDAFGNLNKTTDAAINITSMNYDIRGRKTDMSDPDMGAWIYKYDTLGNLTSQTDAKMQATTMVYDQLGRMTSRTELEGTSNWYYDSYQNGAPCYTGSLCEESSPAGSKSYSYDTAGRALSATTNLGVNGSYTVS
ncbi:MAG: hypothetical protein JKY87_08180, partial [Mariprofundus sp.]|nr:hypothetical protein [Mariprofundus sp.]